MCPIGIASHFASSPSRGMAFHVRTDSLNHSPQWYESKGLDEDSPPSRVAFINADVKLMDRDDPKMTPGEKLGLYTEAWNEILSGKQGNVSVADLQEVLEREGLLGIRPQEEYSQGGFKAIARSMEKFKLTPNDVREFLKWTAKNENAKKARAKKLKSKKVTQEEIKKMNIVERKKFFDEGGEVEKAEW